MSTTAGLQARFTLEPRLVEGKWVNVEYIRIISMTDKFNSPHRPVEPADKVRFAAQYEAWKKGLEAPPAGQPLKAWPGITPAEVNVLGQAGIHTVEALAAAADGQVGADGPYAALRDAAQRYLEMASSVTAMQSLQATADEREVEIQVLRARVAALEAGEEAELEQQEEELKPPPPRGRPRKRAMKPGE